MAKVLLVFLTVIIHCATGAALPTPAKICKTEWFDIDNPTGDGDYELFNLLIVHSANRVCIHPTACEVETTSGVPVSQTGDVVEPCNVARGFFCNNTIQTDHKCEDYRIRYTCPESFCAALATQGKICKTEWFNTDDPSDDGDNEFFHHIYFQLPGRVCLYPTACEVETTSGVPVSQTGDVVEPCNVVRGFFCSNKNQPDHKCEDYRIRFTCPESFCTASHATPGAGTTVVPGKHTFRIL